MYIYGVFRQGGIDDDAITYGTLIFNASDGGPALFPGADEAMSLRNQMDNLHGAEYDYVVYRFELNPNAFRAIYVDNYTVPEEPAASSASMNTVTIDEGYPTNGPLDIPVEVAQRPSF